MDKWTYCEIGRKEGLFGETLRVFAEYMATRFKEGEGKDYHLPYTLEWVERFKSGNEFKRSDGEGVKLLKKLYGVE